MLYHNLGRDTVDFTAFMVVAETELLVFGVESWLLGLLLTLFCRKEKYLLWSGLKALIKKILSF